LLKILAAINLISGLIRIVISKVRHRKSSNGKEKLRPVFKSAHTGQWDSSSLPYS
jgi:hypothetical protein